FTLGNLPPEELVVLACTSTLACAEAKPIRSDSADVEILLSPAAWLVVAVSQGEGPLCAARVEVIDAQGLDRAAVQAPEASLRFLTEGFDFSRRWIGPLPAGRYEVSVRLSDGRSQERSIVTDGETETRLALAFEGASRARAWARAAPRAGARDPREGAPRSACARPSRDDRARARAREALDDGATD